MPHSTLPAAKALQDESGRILKCINDRDYVMLLDENGKNISSPDLSNLLLAPLQTARPIVVIIGGAYGVDDDVRNRSDYIWSLSKLVFPHQLVRLILSEQIYRAQEIALGHPYHHE